MATMLKVNEIFHSIQGESTWAGCPCVFVRLSGCHLRCAYCDTEYAFREGEKKSVDEVVEVVERYRTKLVEITGGEPLLQKGVHELIARLCDAGKAVLIETSGACDISECDPRAIRIVDLKTPGSGEVEKNLLGNIEKLTKQDEVKFVITSREDYEWARGMVREHGLTKKVKAVLFSPVFEQKAGLEIAGCEGLDARELAGWMLADGWGGEGVVRMQMQMHKFIWEPSTRGV
ncbi:MAG TPA: radical SAM protein [Phycisphaerales bacterium]|nr:radical SAM protein [Phycisphaerales bacterium]